VVVEDIILVTVAVAQVPVVLAQVIVVLVAAVDLVRVVEVVIKIAIH